jgi:hypothetical protein
MAWALLITWRDGKQEYLRDRATGRVERFASRPAAIGRRREMRPYVEWELAGIDIVPAPRDLSPTPPEDPPS